MEQLKAGRELDALVAEKVMGISLTPSRAVAMAKVAWRHIRMTGESFTLDDKSTVDVPPGGEIPDPGTGDWNDRYAWYVASQREQQWADEIAAFRFNAEPYSTSIAAAWEVVTKLRAYLQLRETGTDEHYWSACFGGDGWLGVHGVESAPLAICRAALNFVTPPKGLETRKQ